MAIALAIASSSLLPWAPVQAQDKAMAEQLRQMAQRLERLEQRNQELERQLKAMQSPAPTALGAAPATPVWGDARRVETLEREQRALARRVDDLSRQGDLESGAEDSGPKIEASVVGIVQNVNRAGAADARTQTRANYRGDLTVELPAGSIGGAQVTAFGHLRFGQGEGLSLRPTHTSTVNSVGFQTAAGPDDSFAILAQGFLNLEWSLGGGA
jgi:uncharacterized protein (UPF0335 family)